MTDQLQLEMGAGMADIADIVSGVRERSINGMTRSKVNWARFVAAGISRSIAIDGRPHCHMVGCVKIILGL